jgi:Domain of unknown function (DUF1707)/Domain of unknown function (DUF4190)
MAAIPSEPAGPHAMRAGDADRDRVIDVLRAAFAEGRLTDEELADRMAKTLVAKTYGDLAELVSDLLHPLEQLPAAPYTSPAEPAGEPLNRSAVASLVCGLAMFPTLGLTALPAVVLGSRAMKQIRETGQRGESLAVVGQVLGWIAMGVFFVAVLGIMIWLIVPPGPGAGGPIGG